jgi:RHS repeat-associated protein
MLRYRLPPPPSHLRLKATDYTPTGDVDGQTLGSSVITNFTYEDESNRLQRIFTGQRLDESTGGLMYYGARYYLPSLRRFISADTIVPGAGNPQNLNRYSYVRNNPVNLIDPTGHRIEDDPYFHAVNPNPVPIPPEPPPVLVPSSGDGSGSGRRNRGGQNSCSLVTGACVATEEEFGITPDAWVDIYYEHYCRPENPFSGCFEHEYHDPYELGWMAGEIGSGYAWEYGRLAERLLGTHPRFNPSPLAPIIAAFHASDSAREMGLEGTQADAYVATMVEIAVIGELGSAALVVIRQETVVVQPLIAYGMSRSLSQPGMRNTFAQGLYAGNLQVAEAIAGARARDTLTHEEYRNEHPYP